jgi:hypothetical protein
MEPIRAPFGVNVPGFTWHGGGFAVSLHGRIWVTPEDGSGRYMHSFKSFGYDYLALHDKDKNLSFSQIEEECEILGRPIRPADVLLAYIYSAKPAEKVIHANKHLDTELKIMMRWNLRADRLEDQSDETISFPYELLE